MSVPRLRGRPRAFDDRTAQNLIQSLDRAMGLLAALAASPGLTLSELAQRTHQSPATVYRVLVTLEAHGITELDAQRQIWHVGAGAFRIGSAFLRRTTITERARAPMQELMRQTGETANLGIEQGDEVLFLTQVETHEAIRAFFPPGTRSPLHASGIGKALLSWAPNGRVEALIARGLPQFTPRTLTTGPALAADLEVIRLRGFAIDDEERTPGMRCIAAPIFNSHTEPVAGLSISAPAFRLAIEAAELVGMKVRRAADEVTETTGGRRPDASRGRL